MKNGTAGPSGVADARPSGLGSPMVWLAFVAGAFGGVALDVMSLYFQGASDAPAPDLTVWRLGGTTFRVVSFMLLTGVLAALYADGDLRKAFVIGIAAPSILLNLAASVAPHREIPTIPSGVGASLDGSGPAGGPAPAPGSDRPDLVPPDRQPLLLATVPVRVEYRVAQAWTTVPTRVTLGTTRVDEEELSGGAIFIYDAAGRVLAKTLPRGQTVVFQLPPGAYTVQFVGPTLESSPTRITVDPFRGADLVLPLQARQPEPWGQFLKGAADRFERLRQAK